MTTEAKDESTEKVIGWRYFALCGFAGLAPYGLLMACLPLFRHFNCRLSWRTVCDGHSWVVTLADAVTGFSWLVILTFPLSAIFLMGGLAINFNRWTFRGR
ncbi:hypothetical protein [Polaromonas sp. LjRoot131]|uniref:hypothetical protein n=1 Tax=Polaromonas sp. LjRoot131 TaxID=3342262 RepID=UPI003ECC30E7